MMLTKEEKRAARRDIGRVSRFALIYTIIFTLVSWSVVLGVTVARMVENPQISYKEIEGLFYSTSGQYSLAALAVGALFVLIVRRRKLFSEDLRNPEGPATMRWQLMAGCIVLMLLFQAFSAGIDPLIKWVAGQLGFSVSSTIDAIADTPTTLWTILYAGFLGPIMEEVVFRGVVLNGLRKYGKGFAIVTSAFLFAIFHGDLNQGLFAFCGGLVFGYLAMEYSIKWSILLHIINNFVFADVLGRITGLFPANVTDIIECTIIFGIGGIGGVLLLIRKRKAIAEYLRSNRSLKGTVAACWTTPSFLIFLALEVAMMTMAFTEIG